MSMSSHLLERAVGLWKSGQKSEARRIFQAIIYNDEYQESAWIWYIYTLDTDSEKIAALETFLNIFPQHATAQKALENLKAEVGQPASSTNLEADPKSQKTETIARGVLDENTQTPLVRSSTSRVLPWVLVLLGVCILLYGSLTFSSRYNSLQSSYRALISSNQTLSQNYDQLDRDYEALRSDNFDLTNAHNALIGQFNSLNSDHARLVENYNSLYSDHSLLVEKYNGLSGEYNTLNNISIKPPYIVVHDRMVDTAFYDTDGNLISWTTPFVGLEHEIERGYSTRSLMMDRGLYTSTVYTEEGNALGIRDFTTFITPEPFTNVMKTIYDKSSNPHEFVYKTWNIIGQLSNYTSEEGETPRYPYETLLAGGGDCEDLAILFVSLIKAAPVDWYVDLVYVDAYHVTDPETHNHVIVYIDTGQETFIVETTNDQTMQPYDNGVVGWLAGTLGSSNEAELYPIHLR